MRWVSARWPSTPPRSTVLIGTAVPSLHNRLARAAASTDMTVIATAASPEDAVTAALEHLPQVCALDLAMSEGMLSTLAEIQCLLPRTRILALDREPNDDAFLDAVRAGAFGYLAADSPVDQLAISLREVVHGAAFGRRFLATLVDEFRTL